MCKHNDIEDYDCVDCAYNWGYHDAVFEEYDNHYKDAWQAEDYTKGYERAISDLENNCLDKNNPFL